MSEIDWYLLIHQLPAKPLYLRAKIRNRLASLGAAALKDSVYVLPAREELRPQLESVARDARSGGGAAHLLTARFVDSQVRDHLIESFRRERNADYAALTKNVRRWAAEPQRGTARGSDTRRLVRAKKKLDQIRAIDYFDAPGYREALDGLSLLKDRPASGPAPSHPDLVGRTWVTRRGIQIDRIASAWLIRRFLDPKARLRFVDPGSEEIAASEIRFDMHEGDFTHDEDRCTVETLIFRTGIKDSALDRVAAIVHEIDIKDDKYSCPETKGVQQILNGMLRSNPDDDGRLERGFAMLDDLYQSFRQSSRPAS